MAISLEKFPPHFLCYWCMPIWYQTVSLLMCLKWKMPNNQWNMHITVAYEGCSALWWLARIQHHTVLLGKTIMYLWELWRSYILIYLDINRTASAICNTALFPFWITDGTEFIVKPMWISFQSVWLLAPFSYHMSYPYSQVNNWTKDNY